MSILFIFFLFLFGLCLGSFLNALVYRLHSNITLWGRSMCPNCKAQIKWYDNIPVFSFIFLKGQCRNCHKKISWQYPIVELITAILFTLPFLVLTNYWQAGVFSLITFFLVFIFLYDFKYQEIHDLSIWPLVILVLDLYIFSSDFSIKNILNPLLAATVAGGFFGLQYLISKGKWIGAGDIGLGVLMGVVLDWPNILAALFIAYVLGGIVGVILLLLKKRVGKSEIAFGTFLTVATYIVLLWGDIIVAWFVGLL